MAICKDEACIFSSEFKDRGDELPCGAFCDLLSVTAAAGEEDQVRASIDEAYRLFGAVVQHLHQVDWKICLRTEPHDQSGRLGSAFRTLKHHGVTRSERRHDGNHR